MRSSWGRVFCALFSIAVSDLSAISAANAADIQPMAMNDFWIEQQRDPRDVELVIVEATVTYHDPLWKILFFQDGNASSYLSSERKQKIEPGTRIQLRAEYIKNSWRLLYDVNSLNVLETVDALPEAEIVRSERLFSAHLTDSNSSLIESTGTIVCVDGWDSHIAAYVESGSQGAIPIYVPTALTPEAARSLAGLMGQPVRFTAVVGERVAPDGRKISSALYVSDLKSFEAIHPTDGAEPESEVVRAANGTSALNGIVTAYGRDGVFLQSESGSEYFRYPPVVDDLVGQKVDVIVAEGDPRQILTVRRHGLSEARPVKFNSSNLSTMDAELVHCRGAVVDVRYEDDEIQLLLESGDVLAAVSVPGSPTALAQHEIPTAKEIEVVGVCSLPESPAFLRSPSEWGSHNVAVSIQCRSSHDLVVMSNVTGTQSNTSIWLFGALGTAVLLFPFIWYLRRNLVRKSQELQFVSSHLESLYVCSPVSTIVTSRSGAVLSANPSARKLFGHQNDSESVAHWPDISTLIGKTFRSLPNVITDGMATAVREGRFQCSLSTIAVPEKHANIAAVPMEVTGRVAGFVLWVITDTTESVKRRQQMYASERAHTVGQMAGGLAHNFNNVLQIISGNLEIARACGADEFELLKSRVRLAEDATASASELIKRLLNLASNTNASIADVSTCELIGNVRSLVSGTFGDADELQFVEPEPDIVVRADRFQLEQALLNLCFNARSAIEEDGRIRLSVERRRNSDSETQWAVIKCCDNGCGIPPANLDRIFEPYFTTRGNDRGTGLGLACARTAIECMGGTIEVDSVVGVGSEFRIVLPVAKSVSETVPSRLPSPHFATSPSTVSSRVLVADDDEAVRAVTVSCLETVGHRVDEVSSGHAALQLLEDADGEYDVVILDRRMPGLTGDQVLEAVSQRWPNLRVIICTGFMAPADSSTLPNCEFIKKPYRIGDMQALIARNGGRRTTSKL